MRKRELSLRKMLTDTILFFSVLLLILMLFMNWYLISRYQLEKRHQEMQALENAADSVHSDMLRTNYTLYDICGNNEDFRALTGEMSDLENFSHSYDLNEALKVRMLLEDHFNGHFLLYNGGQSTRYFVDQEVIDPDDIYELRVHIKELLREKNAVRKWQYVIANGSRYALLPAKEGNISLCMLYNLTNREKVFQESAPKDCELFFVETDGNLGDGKNAWEQGLMQELEESSGYYSRQFGGYHISAYRIGNTRLWLCMRVRINLFFYMSPGQLLLLFVTVAVVIGLVVLRRRLEEYMVVPLRRLVQTMNCVRDGQWDAKVESADYEEIQMVNDALETMVGEIRKQKILTYEHRLEAQQTQMRFLQLQLKPHFYLNGLKTLNAMVMEEDWRSTQDVIISLSEHMRYLLQAERELVPLQAELEFVKNYTRLQSQMTGRTVDIQWNIRTPGRNWLVPVLCIQTFLENSFKYARIGSVQKHLQLRLSVRELETEEGAYLDISVRDNGQGYPEDVLDCINDEPEREGPGVGIKNLQRRCALIYGGRAQHNYYNDNGAVSELILPWKEDTHEDPDRG